MEGTLRVRRMPSNERCVRDARGVGEGAMMRGWDDGERREVFKGFDARGGRVDARRGWMRE